MIQQMEGMLRSVINTRLYQVSSRGAGGGGGGGGGEDLTKILCGDTLSHTLCSSLHEDYFIFLYSSRCPLLPSVKLAKN